MAGLLNLDDPNSLAMLQFGLGLLQAGGYSPQRTTLGQAIGGAGQGAVGAYTNARQQQIENQRRQEMLEMQRKLQASQIAENEAQMQARQAAVRRQADIDNAFKGVVQQPYMGAEQGPPIPPELARPVLDRGRYEAAMAQYFPKDYIDYLEKQKPPKPESNTPLEIINAVYPEGHPQRAQALKDLATKTTTHAPIANITSAVLPGQKTPSVLAVDRYGRVINQIGEKPPTGSPGAGVSNLRKEFENRYEVKTFRQAIPVLEAAKSSPDTAQGDLQLIYAAGKVLDPNSVVREGEMSLVVRSGTPEERIMGFISYIAGGQRMTPQARQNLIKALEGRVVEYQRDFDAVAGEYKRMAQENGMKPEDVVVNPTQIGRSVNTGGSNFSGMTTEQLEARRRQLQQGKP